jgi:uncharacterized protein YecE (DUF72 family)
MVDIQIGTAGWAYNDWVGSFYPDYISKDRFLAYYSKFFRIVETNSTHYTIPKSSTLKKWMSSVPESFKFSIKVWNQITHIKDYASGIKNLNLFLNAMDSLSGKIAYYLLQFPPTFKNSETNLNYVEELLSTISPEQKVAVEFRNNSWFDPSILKAVLNGKNHILGTVYLDNITPYYPEWQKNYYIRIIGDRSLTSFDKVQRSIPQIWNHLNDFIVTHIESTDIVEIFVIFNNHYSGFSPADSNKLKKSLNLPFKAFDKKKNITDFF